MKRYKKYFGFKPKSKREIKAYIKQRLLRHEFQLRRARKKCRNQDVIRIIHVVTKELRSIYSDLFKGDDDDKTTKKKIK